MIQRGFVTIDDPRWKQCHGSTIELVDGTPVVAWFAGTHEGTPDNRIVISAGGAERVLDTGLGVAHWNPVLSLGPDGALWLFCKAGPRISEWITLVTRSHDGGRTWEPVRELVPGDRSGGRGPVRSRPLWTDEGLWLAPGSVEYWGEPQRWDPFVDVSEDAGRTWTTCPIPVDHAELKGAGHIQPALWWGESGPVALMRSTEGRAYRATSPDGGRSWTAAVPTGLPNNNSGLTALGLPTGRVVCVHNPATESWGSRCPLVVSLSDDDGITWRTAMTLDDGVAPVDPAVPRVLDPVAVPGFAPGDAGIITSGVAEYSYPSAVLAADRLLVTYTWQRRGIVLAEVPLAELER